jgi:hypothetical protein
MSVYYISDSKTSDPATVKFTAFTYVWLLIRGPLDLVSNFKY